MRTCSTLSVALRPRVAGRFIDSTVQVPTKGITHGSCRLPPGLRCVEVEIVDQTRSGDFRLHWLNRRGDRSTPAWRGWGRSRPRQIRRKYGAVARCKSYPPACGARPGPPLAPRCVVGGGLHINEAPAEAVVGSGVAEIVGGVNEESLEGAGEGGRGGGGGGGCRGRACHTVAGGGRPRRRHWARPCLFR